MPLEDVIFETSISDLIFVGEHHDKMHHHINQLKIIRELHEKAQVPLAIGLEMFERRDQDILENWIKGQLETEQFIRFFIKTGDSLGRYTGHIYLCKRTSNTPCWFKCSR